MHTNANRKEIWHIKRHLHVIKWLSSHLFSAKTDRKFLELKAFKVVTSHSIMERINITEDGKVFKEIIKVGTGAEAKEGDKVKVHYVGTLESDGSKFDSSRDRGEPFSFTIGQGVIQGWSLGVATMKVGELSKFTISSEYGYGASGSPPKIPGGATLVFEIELLSIVKTYKTNEDAIAAADEIAKVGTDAFKAGKFDDALASYMEALDIVNEKWGSELDEIKNRLNRNASLVYCKLGLWKDSLEYAEKVLSKDKADLKAMMRKLDAEMNLGRLDAAQATLDKALATSKRDPAFVAKIAALDKLKKAERLRQDQLFKKMAKQ